MAGYSGTPLSKKLGLADGQRVCIRHAPQPYAQIVPQLPDVVLGVQADAQTDLVHLFARERRVLAAELAALRHAMRDDAVLWVSWPKKAAKLDTDITEDVVRELGLPLGFVDVKVCAVDAQWSGLKLVVRRELRAPRAGAAPAPRASRRR